MTNWAHPEIAVAQDAQPVVHGADAVIICLPDPLYRPFLAELLKKELSSGAIVIDPWNMVVDACAADFVRRDITLKVYGRGDYERASAR